MDGDDDRLAVDDAVLFAVDDDRVVARAAVDRVVGVAVARLDRVVSVAATQVVGAVAFMTYGGACVPNSIWLGTPWKVTGKNLLDALIYGCVTAGAFGWLWPR